MSSSSFFQREPVDGGERQIHKQADPAIQNKECLAESLSHLLLGSLRGSRIGNGDGARRVPRAQKKHVVISSPYGCTAQLQQLGPQHGIFSAGFTPRMKALRTFPSTCGAIFSTSIPCPARNTLASSARWTRVGSTSTCSKPAAVNLAR